MALGFYFHGTGGFQNTNGNNFIYLSLTHLLRAIFEIGCLPFKSATPTQTHTMDELPVQSTHYIPVLPLRDYTSLKHHFNPHSIGDRCGQKVGELTSQCTKTAQL